MGSADFLRLKSVISEELLTMIVADEAEEAWRIVDSIVAGWKQSKRRPDEYVAGTWGPERAEALLGGGRAWRKP